MRGSKQRSVTWANLNQTLRLRTLSGIVNLSPWRLCHLFKQELRLSPMRYLKSARIQAAKDLLETTFLDIKEIMVRVGAQDRSHFARDFRETCGVSATQYRSSSRELPTRANPLPSKKGHLTARTATKLHLNRAGD